MIVCLAPQFLSLPITTVLYLLAFSPPYLTCYSNSSLLCFLFALFPPRLGPAVAQALFVSCVQLFVVGKHYISGVSLSGMIYATSSFPSLHTIRSRNVFCIVLLGVQLCNSWRFPSGVASLSGTCRISGFVSPPHSRICSSPPVPIHRYELSPWL